LNPKEEAMDNELRNGASERTSTTEQISGIVPGVTSGQMGNTATVPPVAMTGFDDPGKKRRERIEKMKAKLQREIARDSTAARKERNGQLFVWGAMVEGVYRDGNANEREQLRQWAKRMLTDNRHLKRAECSFARIEDEAANA
jgi:hypothetical protein